MSEIAPRMNHEIKHDEIRLIGPNSEFIGIMNSKEANRVAYEMGLDLIDVSPNSTPAVCRVCDWGKFLYEKSKKQTHTKKQDTKQIKLQPNIGEHDLEIKLKNVKRLVDDGDRVKIIIEVRGRVLIDNVRLLGNKILEKVSAFSTIEKTLSMEGNQMNLVVIPLAKKV